MRRGFLGAVLFVFIATACDGEYPEEAVRNFMVACASQPGATEDSCRCVIEGLQEKMSFEEFRQAEADVASGDASALPPEFVETLRECGAS